MDTLLQDIRIGFRRLYLSRAFAALVIGTLAIGIGANTAVFTLVNAIHLRPLPFAEPSELVDLYENNPAEVCAGCGVGTSYANFLDWQHTARSFSGMAAYNEVSAAVRLNENAQKHYVAHVSADVFPLLGVAPLRGRFFNADEARTSAPVALISEQLALSAYGDAASAVGRTIFVEGSSVSVIGVMPSRFVFPEHADVWLPFAPSVSSAARNDRSVGVVARLRDNVSTQQASAELSAIGKNLAQQFPVEQKGWNAFLTSLHDDYASDYTSQGTLLLSAVSCVLLIVCANLANLMLARASSRRPELAVRAALGASRAQLARQMLIESLLISFSGGMLGLIVALWGIELLRALAADALPRWIVYEMDWHVFVYAFFVSTVTGLLFGLMPARFAARASVADVLKEGARGSTNSRSPVRVRDLLVIVQVAVAFTLVVTAGLLTKSIMRTSTLDIGYDMTGLMRADLGASGAKYSTPQLVSEYASATLSEIRLGRGVKSAAISGSHFLNWPGTPQQTISIEGVPAERSERVLRRVQGVTLGYFETLGLQQVAGRLFQDTDGSGAPRVAVVSRAFAQNVWSDSAVVGRHLRVGTEEWTVVGVIEDVRESPIGRDFSPIIYVPLAQLPLRQPDGQPLTLNIRTVPGGASIPALVRLVAQKIDPNVTTENILSVEEFMRQWRRPMQTIAIGSAVLGAFSCLLAALGIYGVIAYVVSQRTHEIGIRMALGASVKDVVLMVMKHGVSLAVVGTLIGVAGAGVFTQLLRNQLFGVSPLDPVVYMVVGLIFLSIALLAVYLPSQRASRVHPMEALRTE